MPTPDPIPLLQSLLAAKSYSREEAPAADALERWLRDAGVTFKRVGDNLIAEKGTADRALLFNSHLDTVPASNRWTRDPWTADIEGDQLFGLGATDAKSSVASMAAAFVAMPDPGDAARFVLTATTEEETGGMPRDDGTRAPNGMEVTLPMLGPLAAGIVGEPTRLNICPIQRGMVRIVIRTHGRAGHASRPWEGRNAIELLAEVLPRLRTVSRELTPSAPAHGQVLPTLQPTIISGGTAKNVIPDLAEITLDLRSTARVPNTMLIEQVRRALADVEHVEVDVISQRFQPVETAPDTPLMRAARHALPEAELLPFGGVSDLYFVATSSAPPVPAVLIGPGDGRQSHQPDEFVSIRMVRAAAEAYHRLAEAWLERAS